MISRRGFLATSSAALLSATEIKSARAQVPTEIRIGYQKNGVLVVAREQAALEKYFAPRGITVSWFDFPAWAVWDPYFAIGEVRGGGRVLAKASDVGKTNSFYIANRDFAAHSPQLVSAVIDVLAKSAGWAETHRDQVGQLMAKVTGVDADIQTLAAQRSAFAIGKLTDDLIATQQAVADRFFRLGLIPRQIAVREAVWVANQS